MVSARQMPPNRWDVALHVLDKGWARVNVAEAEKEGLRQPYQFSEEDAKRGGRGIWSKENRRTE